MKKVILSVVVVALAAVVMSSCNKDKTNEELLTNSKGWVISKAISSPEYTNSGGVTSADLTKSWFYPCELNDVLKFISDKDGKRTVLTTTCDGNVKTKETLGKWGFTSEEKDNIKLKFRLPFFEEDEEDVVKVTALEEDIFEFEYTWSPDGDGEKYKFTITYKPGK